MEASSRNVALGLVAPLVLIGGIAWWLMQPSYGEISPKGYQIAMAIYSAANQENKPKVEKISGMIDQSVAAAEISAEEAEWLRGIVQKAMDGDWQSATAAVRLLMEEQARPAEQLPKVD